MHRVRSLQREDETVEPDRKTSEVRPRAISGAQELEKVGTEHGQLIARAEAVLLSLRQLETEGTVSTRRLIEPVADINHDMVDARNWHCWRYREEKIADAARLMARPEGFEPPTPRFVV